MSIKSFKEFITEQSGRMEIPTNKAKEYAPKLKALGAKVEKADLEGLVINVPSKEVMKKVHDWMLKNGWDETDIEDMHS